MDERRLIRALRDGPVDDPAYEPLGRDGLLERRARGRRRARRVVGDVGRFAAVLGLAAALIVAVVLVRAQPRIADSVGRSALDDVRATGRIRIVVTTGPPQVETPERGIVGFDADIAAEVARRLGARPVVSSADDGQVLAGGWGDTWDLSIGSLVATNDRMTISFGEPYWFRDGAVVVREGASLDGIEDLRGSTICVAPDSLAEAWVGGSLQLVNGTAAAPPDDISVLTETTCRDLVASGAADAYVADVWLTEDPPPAGLRRLDEVPFTGAASPAVDPTRHGAAELLTEVDRVIGAMRSDGSLRSLSERRFGGRDLTEPGGS